MAITAVIDTQTNEFLPYGHDLDARYIAVAVARNPDHLREKYSGNPASPFAAKSAAEIAATLDAATDAEAGALFDPNRLLKAVAISNLARALGKSPGALTAGEIAAERTRILAIYKGLS